MITTSDPLYVPKIKPDRPPRYNFVRNPEKLAEARLLSASVVGEKHRVTFRPKPGVGLILSASAENVLASREVDMHSNIPFDRNSMNSPEVFGCMVSKLAELYPPRSPRSLLSITPAGVHNEVLLRGKAPSGEILKAVGYIVIETNGHPAIDDVTLTELEKLSRANSLPIVRLPWDGVENWSAEYPFTAETERNNLSLSVCRH